MTDEMTIEDWLKRMREPVNSWFVESNLFFPDRDLANECQGFVGIDEDWEVDWGEEMMFRYEKAKDEFHEMSKFVESAPEALAFLRSQPLPGDIMVPRYEESAWMSPKERELVEWFDRGEYSVFLRLAGFFGHDKGWIVRYCVHACIFHCKGLTLEGRGDIHETLLWREIFDDELIAKIKAAAEEGNARALNCLGLLHKTGWAKGKAPIEQDLEKARDLFRRSAEAGCTQGMANYANSLVDGTGGPVDLDAAERISGEPSSRGLGAADYALARIAAVRHPAGGESRLDAFAAAMSRAAERGNGAASGILAASGQDRSPDRMLAEYLFATSRFSMELRKRRARDEALDRKYPVRNLTVFPIRRTPAIVDEIFPEDEPSLMVVPRSDLFGDGGKAGKDRRWIAESQPPGAVIPPAGGRETTRLPNLDSANPSFAAKLIMLVRDRFNGNAPEVYGAAHLSRKTYSSIIGNELRPVSKPTAILLALGLRLGYEEACQFIGKAGYAFSDFILVDVIVSSCIKAGIHDVNRVNEILAAHGAKTFPAAED